MVSVSATQEVRFLLVEDDPDDILLLEKQLLKIQTDDHPFRIDKTGRLGEAMEHLAQQSYDVVFLDLSLPDSQGIQTFTQLHEKSPHTAIVVCSGLSDLKIAAETIQKGAQDYIVKGQFDRAMLERVIHYTLSRAHLQEAREEFIGMIVHEFRSPLTIVCEGASQILEGLTGDVSEGQREYLTAMLHSGQHLTHLIDNLLEAVQFETGNVRLNKENVNFTDLAREAGRRMRPLIERKKLTFEENYSQDYLPAVIDRNRITQVLINLLSNAVKYTPSGTVRISVDEDEQNILCAIEDTGIGIKDEELEKMFTKFKRFDNAIVTKQKGTGLGLFVTKWIMGLHQGTIVASKRAGGGTRIQLSLPKQGR